MKNAFAVVISGWLLFTTLLAAVPASAQFARSEDELMQADINEARHRAQDFKNYMALVKKRQIEQDQIGPQEVKKAREAEEKRRELSREAYVRERDARPVKPEVVYSRLEAQFDAQAAKDAEKMEASRRKYLEKRARVREAIQRDGYIDERLEYNYF